MVTVDDGESRNSWTALLQANFLIFAWAFAGVPLHSGASALPYPTLPYHTITIIDGGGSGGVEARVGGGVGEYGGEWALHRRAELVVAGGVKCGELASAQPHFAPFVLGGVG